MQQVTVAPEVPTALPVIDDTRPPLSKQPNLWESINGPGSWKANPWVWVVEFRRAA